MGPSRELPFEEQNNYKHLLTIVVVVADVARGLEA